MAQAVSYQSKAGPALQYGQARAHSPCHPAPQPPHGKEEGDQEAAGGGGICPISGHCCAPWTVHDWCCFHVLSLKLLIAHTLSGQIFAHTCWCPTLASFFATGHLSATDDFEGPFDLLPMPGQERLSEVVSRTCWCRPLRPSLPQWISLQQKHFIEQESTAAVCVSNHALILSTLALRLHKPQLMPPHTQRLQTQRQSTVALILFIWLQVQWALWQLCRQCRAAVRGSCCACWATGPAPCSAQHSRSTGCQSSPPALPWATVPTYKTCCPSSGCAIKCAAYNARVLHELHTL